MAHIKQSVLTFDSPLSQTQPPSENQRRAIERMRALAPTLQGCEALETAMKSVPGAKTTESLDVRVDRIANPGLRQLAATAPVGRVTDPVIAQDGVGLIMVCARETRNVGVPGKKELADQLFSERVDLLSRQMMRGLQRRAVIDVKA